MKKVVSLVLLAFIMVNSVMAQTLADGIKMLSYEKNQTAIDIFKKLYDANQKDPQSIYWYGQGFLAFDDMKGAKAVYQKALQDGINDALIIVGMGHVELMEGGDVNSAKQKFEQAITMTKTIKDKKLKLKLYPYLLNAIGRANADGGSKIGDPTYGVEKLKEAAEIDLKTADISINMGINYLKMGADEGGDAVKAYMDAATREPNNPIASYRIGKIYQSQNNKELFEQYYNTAIAADPTFPPVYLSLYDYYAYRDVSKAKDYIEKYIKYADKSCETEYFYADYLFREGKYQESIEKAKQLESGECKSYYRTSLLYAYNYDRLGDTTQAKTYIDKYFVDAPAKKLRNTDFDIAIDIYSKVTGSEATAAAYIQKAMDADTNVINKVKYCNRAAAIYGKAKLYGDQIKWLEKAIQLKGGTMGEFDFYNLANTAFSGKDYAATMEISKKYIAAFPDKPQGYSFNVRSAKGIDTSATLGLAVEPILQQNDFLKKQNDILIKDTIANKKAIDKNTSIMYSNFCYLMGYYNDVQKDVPKALEACDSILALYPDISSEQNKFGVKIKDALQKSQSKATGGKPAANSKQQK